MAYPNDEGQTYSAVNGTDVTQATLGDGLTHAERHTKIQEEVTALKNKVGTNGDLDNFTLDFKTSEITGGDTAVGKTATQTLTNKTLTSPTINTPTINTPTINTPTINTATINTATINTATINTATINTPTLVNAIPEVTSSGTGKFTLQGGWWEINNVAFEYHATNAIKTTTDIDVTGLIQVGDKITFEQATDGEKFFFITAIDYNSTVANRTYIELYGGTDYDVDNEAITADTVGFSRIANPYGYPAYFQGTKQRVQVLAGGQVQIFGWGAIDGGGSARVTESVTFPITFSEAPYLAVGTYGRTAASSPTNLTDITSTMATSQGYVCYAYSVSSTGFTAAINNTDQSQPSLTSGTYYGYTYTVQGKL